MRASRNTLDTLVLIALILLFFTLPAWASDVKINVGVDKTVVRFGESVRLEVTVSGTQNAPQPQIPKTGDFKLMYHGQSSQFQMINGSVTTKVTFTYTVVPMKQGEISVGPILLEYKGEKLSSAPIKINVMAEDAQVKEAEPVVLRTTLSQTSAYYNQQLIYTLEFGRRVDVANARLELPKFEGFWVEELGKQKEEYRMLYGQRYLVTELRKALFPNKTGEIKIDPAVIQCDMIVPDENRQTRDPFDSFFFGFKRRTQTKLLQSHPLTVEVKPLPKEGQPPNFIPLVGDIKLKSEVSKEKLDSGDSTTLTITISGNANIRDANLIEATALDDFKVYDDKPAFEFIPKEDYLMGKKVFKKALVPQKAGQIPLPVFALPYFNPKTGKYEIAQSKTINLQVKGGPEQENLHAMVTAPGIVPKQAIKVLGRDILSIYTDSDALADDRLTWGKHWWYALIFFLPGGTFLGFFLLQVNNRHMKDNPALTRKKKANKIAKEKLSAAAALINEPEKFYPQVSKTVKEYLDDKFDLPGGVLTPREIEEKLLGAGTHATVVSELLELLEHCEYCQFASSAAANKDCRLIFDQAGLILAKLEKGL
ncbi:MAG: protein BatD [Candidatus Schekmanbacteria bacterium]|nr:protein BatD [Candidatus Schekmanbacteria bacterium]